MSTTTSKSNSNDTPVSRIRWLLLTIVLVELPLQWDVNLGYLDELGEFGALAGLNVSVTTFCLVAIYALWLPEVVIEKRRLPRSMITCASLFYLVVIALSIVWAANRRLVFYEFFLMSQAFLLFVYIIGTVRTRKEILFILGLLLVGLAFESMVMMGLKAVGHSVEIAGIKARAEDGDRVGGTVGAANIAASYLVTLLAPCLGVLLSQSGRSLKTIAAGAFALGVPALVFTGSRGGWIGFGLSLVILCSLAFIRGRLSPAVAALILLLTIAVGLFNLDTIHTRLSGDDRGAAHARIPLMQTALRMAADNPLLGVGANNYAVALPEYANLLEFRSEFIYTVHNRYLLALAETGLLGLAAFVWLLLSILRVGWRCWNFDDPHLSPVALGLLAGMLGFMVHMLVDVFHSRPQVEMLWLVAALLVATNRLLEEPSGHVADGKRDPREVLAQDASHDNVMRMTFATR